MPQNFWKNKNVFITGINGFIGGNLSKKLIENEANVFGLIRDGNRSTFIFHEKLEHKITFIDGNITDKDLIARIIGEYNIDAVFHFAAQVEVGVGLTNPFLTYETNIRGTYSLLEGIRQSGISVDSIVIASSDKAYGSYPSKMMPYSEDYPLIPVYPYDVSKASADMIAQSYSREPFSLPIVVTRFCNIYGPGQLNFSAIVPDAIRSALRYSTFIPRGDGKQIRDFIYVKDVVELYLSISSKLFSNPKKIRGEIFNAGTNKGVSVKDLLKKIFDTCQNMKDFEKVVKLMKNKKTVGEIAVQIMDFKKVNKFVGWKPKYSFEKGLNETVEWFREYLDSK